jgi:hypothetical protein
MGLVIENEYIFIITSNEAASVRADCAANPHDGPFRQYKPRARLIMRGRCHVRRRIGVRPVRPRKARAQLLVLLSSALEGVPVIVVVKLICSMTKGDCHKPRLPLLPDRNEKARFRIRPLRAALTTSREVHPEVPPLRRRIAVAGGNGAVCPKTKRELPCSRNYSQPLR